MKHAIALFAVLVAISPVVAVAGEDGTESDTIKELREQVKALTERLNRLEGRETLEELEVLARTIHEGVRPPSTSPGRLTPGWMFRPFVSVYTSS